jgi:methylisocitrate lyase
MAASRPLVVPSVYDGISTLAAAEFGFDAVYVGSYATGATRYGLPDICYLGLADLVDAVRRITAVTDVPVIADGEGGFGNPLHVARTVRELERAGAGAIHIEDHLFGKHISARPTVLPIEQAVDKIKAALDARHSADFLIIARTDAFDSLGPEAVIARAVAFEEAGADAVFPARYGWHDDDAWPALRAAVGVPIVDTDLPGRTAAQAGELGVDVLLYYALTHNAALHGIRAALGELATTGTMAQARAQIPTAAQFDAFLGIEQAREDAHRYRVL